MTDLREEAATRLVANVPRLKGKCQKRGPFWIRQLKPCPQNSILVYTNGEGEELFLLHLMRWLIAIIVLTGLVGGVVAGYKPAAEYWQRRNMPKWRTAEVSTGEIVSVVNATGTVKPKLQISVGSFVSGPIDPDYPIADFNQEVKKGDMLAKIQETIYKANVLRDEANLRAREADVKRVEALLKQAERDFTRALNLQAENKDFIAGAEIDKFRFGRDSLAAQLDLAKAAVQQADAQLAFTEAQLKYTDIKAPEDGTIINRKIDPGQTVAAQFQTPEMFILAPNMREEMYVHASVDEADIGVITGAKKTNLPVTFTVDAYDDLFEGKIEEIRLSSTTTQNVVTYPVVVSAPNPELKLLPGMTASISFEVDRRTDVLKVPNSALRFFPQPQYVRDQDKQLLEGRQNESNGDGQISDTGLSALERATTRRRRSKRHVWLQDGYKLQAVEISVGLSDSQYTELISGELKQGDKLVTGTQPAIAWGQ
jgi:HlyD family secretion protein